MATIAGRHIQHTHSAIFSLLTNGMPLGGIMLSAVAANQDWIIFGTINNGLWYTDPGIITEITEPSQLGDEISIYPNPTAGEYSILIHGRNFTRSSGENIHKITVTDLAGKTLKTPGLKPGVCSNQFSISDLPAGIYFVRIFFEDKWITRKLVKEP